MTRSTRWAQKTKEGPQGLCMVFIAYEQGAAKKQPDEVNRRMIRFSPQQRGQPLHRKSMAICTARSEPLDHHENNGNSMLGTKVHSCGVLIGSFDD
jgi:hypothetical protein